MAVIVSICVCGAVFYHVVYYELLKHYLVRRFLLSINHIRESDMNRRSINDASLKADIAEIAERTVAFIQGVIGTIVGIAVISETYHDFLYARSSILQNFISFVLWYYIYDTYAMCDACNLRINSGVTSVATKCQRVLAKKFPFMIHHFIMFLTFPIAFIFTINKGMGHMFVGCMCFTLHTNLFISTTFIMNLLHRNTSVWYTVFGACAVMSFTFRVLMVPLLYIYYGVQYGLGPVDVVTTMRIQCHVAGLVFTLGQLFLLSQVMGLVKKYFQKQSKRD